MLIIAFVWIITFLIYNYLGSYSIIQKPHNPTNRFFFMITVIFALWTFAALIRNIHHTDTTVAIWRISSLLAWTLGSTSILTFTISLIRQKQSLHQIIHIYYLYIPAIIIIAIELPFIIKNPNSLDSKLVLLTDRIICPVFYLFNLTISLFLLFKWHRKSKIQREKKQSRIILITLALSTILVFLYSDILPLFAGKDLPFLISVFPVIWIWGMWLAITKYGLLEFKPKVAINQVMNNILEGIILVDQKGRIIEANNNIQKLFFLDSKNLKKLTIMELFVENRDLSRQIEDCLLGKLKLVNEEIQFIQKEKNNFLRIMASPVKISNDEVIGLVISAQDLTLERRNTVLAMAVTANHEINQPLTIAKGNLQMLGNKCLNNTKTINHETLQIHLTKALASLNKIDNILTKYRKAKEFTLGNYTDDVKMINFKKDKDLI